MKKTFILLVFVLLFYLVLPFYQTNAIKKLGFEAYDPKSLTGFLDALEVNLTNQIAMIEGKEFVQQTSINGTSLSRGDEILVEVKVGEKTKSKEFNFYGFFPFEDQLFVSTVIRGKQKIFKIRMDNVNIKKL